MPSLRRRQLLDYYLGGLLFYLIGPAVFVLGRILRRNHKLEPVKDICISKLLGGGSLVIALPALLGLRRRYPTARLTLVSTKDVVPFAKCLGIFDRILVIDDRSLVSLVWSSISALVQCFGTDTFIDYEVYSRLSSVFSVLTLARNRIGFYLENVFWRKIIFTHLVFFNRFAGSYIFYEQISRLLGAQPVTMDDCREYLLTRLPQPPTELPAANLISIGPACSDLGKERMLLPAFWLKVAQDHLPSDYEGTICVLGGGGDAAAAQEIIDLCKDHFPRLTWRNECGKRTVAESAAIIARSKQYWGIDSALLHFARHLRIPSISYWGPTAAQTRLRPYPGLAEEIYSREIPCSPCVHVAEAPPCRGNNICIKGLFDSRFRDAVKYYDVTVWYP